MTADAPPTADDLGRTLVRTSVVLFLASPLLLLALLVLGAGRLIDELAGGRASDEVFGAVALATLHLNLLSPLLAKQLLRARARRFLPAESVLVMGNYRATWRLFAHATAVMVAALAAWSMRGQSYTAQRIVVSFVLDALWIYRLVVITVLWFRHARSLGDEVGVLTRVGSAYRGPMQCFLDTAGTLREVIIERVDGVRVAVKYVDAARLAADSGGSRVVDGVREVWRAAEPAGAKVVAGWLGGP